MYKPGFFTESGKTFPGKSLRVLDLLQIQQINWIRCPSIIEKNI